MNLESIQRWFKGEPPNGKKEEVRKAADALTQQVNGLRTNLQEISEADDPFEALVTAMRGTPQRRTNRTKK